MAQVWMPVDMPRLTLEEIQRYDNSRPEPRAIQIAETADAYVQAGRIVQQAQREANEREGRADTLATWRQNRPAYYRQIRRETLEKLRKLCGTAEAVDKAIRQAERRVKNDN